MKDLHNPILSCTACAIFSSRLSSMISQARWHVARTVAWYALFTNSRDMLSDLVVDPRIEHESFDTRTLLIPMLNILVKTRCIGENGMMDRHTLQISPDHPIICRLVTWQGKFQRSRAATNHGAQVLTFFFQCKTFPCASSHIMVYSRNKVYVILDLISPYGYNGLPMAFSILVVSSLFGNSSQRTLQIIACFDRSSPLMCISMVSMRLPQEWLCKGAVVTSCLLPHSAWPVNGPQNPERLSSQLVV